MNRNPYVMANVKTVTRTGSFRSQEKVKVELRPDGTIMTTAISFGFNSYKPINIVHNGYRMFLASHFPVKGYQGFNGNEYWHKRILTHHEDRLLVEESAWCRLLKKAEAQQ